MKNICRLLSVVLISVMFTALCAAQGSVNSNNALGTPPETPGETAPSTSAETTPDVTNGDGTYKAPASSGDAGTDTSDDGRMTDGTGRVAVTVAIIAAIVLLIVVIFLIAKKMTDGKR